MQEMGLEPTQPCDYRHLKPARLPFRHSCEQMILYLIFAEMSIEFFKKFRFQFPLLTYTFTSSIYHSSPSFSRPLVYASHWASSPMSRVPRIKEVYHSVT